MGSMIPLKSNDLKEKADENLLDWGTKHKEAKRFRKRNTRETHRTDYRRDKDRILYAKGFRRLQYKTQVLVNDAGDHHRTRLTHTLEVQQLSTNIAESLGANKELAEAIALGHDLGHTPFGHAVESVLNDKLTKFGGFSHAVQSIRYLEHIKYHSNEEKIKEKEGLNLTKQVLEGILKHDSDILDISFDNEQEYTHQWEKCKRLSPNKPGKLEDQIVYWADKIAYLSHDWDDFVNYGLKEKYINEGYLSDKEIDEVWEPLINNYQGHDNLELRDIVKNLTDNLINNTSKRLKELLPSSSQEVVKLTEEKINKIKNNNLNECCAGNELNNSDILRCALLVNFEDQYRNSLLEARKFLAKKFYGNTTVARMDQKAKYIVSRIFDKYVKNPSLLPIKTQQTIKEKHDRFSKERIIADHIAGMTDRYANKIYEELFLPGNYYY